MMRDHVGKTDPEAASGIVISVMIRKDEEERGRKVHRHHIAGNYRDRACKSSG